MRYQVGEILDFPAELIPVKDQAGQSLNFLNQGEALEKYHAVRSPVFEVAHSHTEPGCSEIIFGYLSGLSLIHDSEKQKH